MSLVNAVTKTDTVWHHGAAGFTEKMLDLMKQIRIIIIDQHQGVRDALRIRLDSTPNVDIVDSVDAAQAMALVESDVRQDVAILGLTGQNDELGFMVRLVELLVAQGTAVLALSSYVDDLARELILQAGASDYRLKNINTPELLSKIELLAAAR